jgi:hypothetical protein
LGKKRRVIANGHGLSPQTFVLLQSSLKKLRQPKKTIGARILSVCVVCCVRVCVFAFCFYSCIFQVVCVGGGVWEGEREIVCVVCGVCVCVCEKVTHTHTHTHKHTHTHTYTKHTCTHTHTHMHTHTHTHTHTHAHTHTHTHTHRQYWRAQATRACHKKADVC